ncbi:MAG: alpha-hydroxy acid oxidase [Alphaproteobacteria bacterium]|nr:alpha-hydroxy acid oxidase [Alphaproteobacteria bacterium]MCY4320378.1 alpha-hydroxy acid oxidase [Alphaproteobacteria bacterium]
MKIDKCVNLEDLRVLAKRRVPRLIYDFIEGGVDDEEGLRRNEDAFRCRSLVPGYMVDVSQIDQSVELFGRTWSSPYGIAPTGGIGNYRHGGDLMLARAARDANIPFIMSGAATASMEEMARETPEHGWYQLYTAKDRSISEDMIRRAADLGIPALVVTVDVPAGANRERNRRNGFGRPLRLTLATKLNTLRHPAWLKDYLRHGLAMLENWQFYAPPGASASEVGEFVSEQIPTSLTWADIERFRALWPRILILKGVMRVDDALRAAQAGVDGLIVSNHGARQLDRAPAPLDVLPALDAAVGERMTLMLDGGIRRGTDILIALASGAKFVFLGRPTLYGAIVGGTAGATKVVTILREEIDKVMAQIGCPSLDHLSPYFLHWDPEETVRNMRR